MLDGINYYPKKKKPLLKRLIWFFLFFLVFSGIWYYLLDLDLDLDFDRSQSTSIIISAPSILEEIEDTIISSIDEPVPKPLIKSRTENLDEVISTYETNTQN